MMESPKPNLNPNLEIDRNRFKPFFDDARYQLKYWQQKKQTTIAELAKKLENAGMPCELIAAEIFNELTPLISRKYLETVLEDKYKRKYEKPKIIITNDGKLEGIEKRNNSHIAPENDIEDSSPQKTTKTYDEEVKSLWKLRRDGESTTDMDSIAYTANKSLPNDLITSTEHNKVVKELETTIAQLRDARNKDYTKTKEFQEQQQLIDFQKLRISELEEIETKTIQEFSFQSAIDMKNPSVNQTQKICQELTFPANKLAKFFMDSRNCKNRMLLSHDCNSITEWRSE